MADYKSLGEEYARNVELLAGLCDVDPQHLHDRMDDERSHLSRMLTADCLNLAETEVSYACKTADQFLENLPRERRRHVNNCGFCKSLLMAIYRPLDLERMKGFLDPTKP